MTSRRPVLHRLSVLALFSLHIFCRTRGGYSQVEIPHTTIHEILLLNSELSATTDHNEDLGLNEEIAHRTYKILSQNLNYRIFRPITRT